MNDVRTFDAAKPSRRQFLKAGLGAAAGVAALETTWGRAAPRPEKSITFQGSIPTRRFGKTGHLLPVFGHGGSAMVSPFIEDKGAPLLPREERVRMVRRGYDGGIRYFDTARAYGESEGIMGEALEDVRENVYLATKIGVPREVTPEAVRRSLETSLGELRTDYVDAIQIHNPSDYDRAMATREALEKLRQEGMVRFIGVTTHQFFPTIHRLLSTGAFDQTLLAFGYFRKGREHLLSNATLEWRDLCLAKAAELGIGVVAMKVLGAKVYGHNARNLVPDYDEAARRRLPGAAIRWALRDERVHVLNIGISIPSDIEENLPVFAGDLTYTNEDARLLADFSGRAYESAWAQGLAVV